MFDSNALAIVVDHASKRGSTVSKAAARLGYDSKECEMFAIMATVKVASTVDEINRIYRKIAQSCMRGKQVGAVLVALGAVVLYSEEYGFRTVLTNGKVGRVYGELGRKASKVLEAFGYLASEIEQLRKLVSSQADYIKSTVVPKDTFSSRRGMTVQTLLNYTYQV